MFRNCNDEKRATRLELEGKRVVFHNDGQYSTALAGPPMEPNTGVYSMGVHIQATDHTYCSLRVGVGIASMPLDELMGSDDANGRGRSLRDCESWGFAYDGDVRHNAEWSGQTANGGGSLFVSGDTVKITMDTDDGWVRVENCRTGAYGGHHVRKVPVCFGVCGASNHSVFTIADL